MEHRKKRKKVNKMTLEEVKQRLIELDHSRQVTKNDIGRYRAHSDHARDVLKQGRHWGRDFEDHPPVLDPTPRRVMERLTSQVIHTAIGPEPVPVPDRFRRRQGQQFRH